MYERHKNEQKHECEITADDSITTKFINSGCFVSLRRKFRSLLIVSASSPRSRLFLKSTYIINREQVHHLMHHYHMIHPLSIFRVYWNTFMIFVLLLVLFIVPLKIMTDSYSLALVINFFDLILLFDCILTFNTGYLDSHSNTVVMQRKKVAINYLTHWFIPDIIASMNFNLIIYKTRTEAWIKPGVPDYFKIVKIFSLFKYLKTFREYKHISLNDMKIFKVFLTAVFVILWTLSIVVISDKAKGKRKEADSMRTFYINCARRTFYMLFQFGVQDIEKKPIYIFIQIFCLTAGVFLNLLIASQFLQIYTKFSWADKKYYQMMRQLQEFMQYKGLPSAMRSRITKYSDYRFQLNYYKEADVMKTSSPQLQQEIMLQVKIYLLEKVAMFENLPMYIMFKLICLMKNCIFLPSDTIVSAGTFGDAMYFISTGSVAVYTATGKEISHLSDGDNFGEISLVMESHRRTATVVAIDCCEIYILYRNDFIKELEQHPDVYEKIKSAANEFLAKKYGMFK